MIQSINTCGAGLKELIPYQQPVQASIVRRQIDDLITRLQFLRESAGEADVRIQQITNLLNDLKSEWRTKL